MRRRHRRLTDLVVAGATDYHHHTHQQRLPVDATDAEAEAYHQGWLAAAKDDLHRRAVAVRSREVGA